jgi:hypothetical protein
MPTPTRATSAMRDTGASTRMAPPSRLLHRKCACDGAPSVEGTCEECRRKPLQRKSVERRRPEGALPPLVDNVLATPGSPLDRRTRAFMEPRFGHDFGDVRVHTDYDAGAAARAVDARAFTVGADVVFAHGQYDPSSFDGKVLLAHELTHVLQQRASPTHVLDRSEIVPDGDPSEREADVTALQVVAGGRDGAVVPAAGRSPRRLARASFKVGEATVNIDYGSAVGVAVTDYVSAIEAVFTSWAAGAASAIHSDLVALGTSAQEWVLFALDLLVDNPVATLDRPAVARRLIDYAQRARFRPLRDSKPGFWQFENEVLMVSGWFEKALTASLKAPTGPYLKEAQKALGVGGGGDPGSSACPVPRPADQTLDEPKLRADLPPKLEARLKLEAPASGLTSQPFATLRSFGDTIQAEAEAFFAPYASRGRGRGNLTLEAWRYSANLVESTSAAAAPTRETRLQFLENRARLVGDKGLFQEVHFDPRCEPDAKVLTDIVETIEKVPSTATLLDSILQHGRSYTEQDAASKRVVLNVAYNPKSADSCTARWKTVETMCHELVHVMAHDDFQASVAGRQVLREGFTEVLGDQLYSRIASKARADKGYQATFEASVAGAPCADIPSAALGYGEGGKSAETLRVVVKDDRFRAAYFLGELELVGIKRKRIPAGARSELESEAVGAEAAVRDGPAPRRRQVLTVSGAAADATRVLSGAGSPLGGAITGGEPLLTPTRQLLETGLGHDFSGVRVHADARAAESARAANARAYTVGSHIVFGAGQYAPGTRHGRTLLAHELTHVAQQAGLATALVQRAPAAGPSAIHHCGTAMDHEDPSCEASDR